MNILYPFLNPLQWIKAGRYAKQNTGYDKSNYDLELYLYSRMLTNNMLHYAYFDDIDTEPETISFEQFENAQLRYAENIIEHIEDKNNPVLDVGCGMGGLSELLSSRHYKVESLTPNKNQVDFIRSRAGHLVTHHCRYEQLKTEQRFGTIINAESLQYISLNEAFKKSDEIILSQGRWIIVDYFGLDNNGLNKKPHNLETFYQKARENNWNIAYEHDITLNILPTLTYINMYVNRFLLPVKHFAFEKLRYKRPRLFYLSGRLREYIDRKIEKEIKTVNPEVFRKERKYMLIVLEKGS